ncbi:DUF4012 domain-containing protein [Cryobacterium sp. CG_9.6]|uniref:DUF4012 domain-containing protein n=1 Tax=Cryobacterium sp. CG_9.6 TaxID=2760710 RepID=UPI0024756FEF|nr:DUF4012 domain-containing protein [Cryobacterium sp. CG_9.6]MDH6235799.1 hypothetical protein [Cryobacterium sp. CG_9.6]
MNEAIEQPVRAHRWRIVWFVALGMLLIVVLGVTWIGVRGLLARDELVQAQTLASTLQKQVVAGDENSAAETFAALSGHAEAAARLTSDPVWRMGESLPLLGANLTAVRQLADTARLLSTEAIGPLIAVAGTMNLAALAPQDGAITLQPIVDAQPAFAAATTSVLAAHDQLSLIDGTRLLPPVRDAHDRFQQSITGVAESLSTVNRAVHLIPAMAGGQAPRTYLVLFQNPAELRSTGGLSGALALLRAENGRFTLERQAGATELPILPTPVFPLPDDTRALYRDITGRYIGNVNLTPNFALTAELARAMWTQKFGGVVDGVLSIDPVALSYLLAATGPITLPTGDVLTADNAVQLLLTDVYTRYPVALDQDKFFADAAAAVFVAVSGGAFDTVGMVTALDRAAVERRVLVWSDDEAEQNLLVEGQLAGTLPVDAGDTSRFGVYFNDATGAKMGTYLRVRAWAAQASCRADGRPSFEVQVELTNTAPADAALTLPPSITGDGSFGVPPGQVKTIVSVYGVPGMQPVGAKQDGAVVGYLPTIDSPYPPTGVTYPVSALDVELAPGQSTVVQFGWLGDQSTSPQTALETTPTLDLAIEKVVDFSC